MRYRSRKFLLAASTLVSVTWLVAAGHIADGVYSAVILGTVGAYIVGNVAQKYVEKP
jgi:hypothetical protein